MRIRKRFLSLSAAITAPPPPPSSSDPNYAGDHQQKHLLLVQQQQVVHPNGNLRVLNYDNTHSQPSDPPPSSADHTTQIGFQTTGAGSEVKELIVCSLEKGVESEKKETIKTNDTFRKESILCAEASVNNIASLPPPTTSHLVLKGWFEGDRLIPIKKRSRGSLGKGANHGHLEDNNEMNIAGTMRPKPKNYETTKDKNKNGKRGNVIMEGSRCSRVNGRGWRCSQQTLVGYSLCEHHLGKGRLRSMNSVRGKAKKVAITKEQDKEVETISMDNDPDFEDDDKDWEEESVSSMENMKKFTKKKKKLGVVKARSLSSLLSQIGS